MNLRNKFSILFICIGVSVHSQVLPDLPEDINTEYKKLPDGIGYNQFVKPIFSDKCFPCHGNDGNKRKAGLRLDLASAAYSPLPQNPTKVALRPGNLMQSEIYHRIVSTDPDYLMPDPQSHLTLSPKEKAILIKWITEGGAYQPHWAFVAPVKQIPPTTSLNQWAINPIDLFVGAKLEKENLKPNKEATKEILLRRLSFDLTGLPPSIAELDSFLSDASPAAYEKQVDRLIQSAHYGEKMAVDWLDLARFADSHGYTVDRLRDMSPYRDWVIHAFNQNLPYSTFIQYQLAGDLMPESTREMKIATAFNRNHPQNMEGGIIENEFQTEYVIDRTNTFGQAFIGLTVGCARCHDHKFDPFSQKNYYELFSFFNNIKEAGQIAWNDDLPTPTLLLPSPEKEKIIQFINNSIARQEEKIVLETAQADKTFDSWLQNVQYKKLGSQIIPAKGLQAYFQFENTLSNAINPNLPGQMRRESDTLIEKPIFESLDKNTALVLDGDGYMDIRHIGIFRKSDPFTIALKIKIPEGLKEGVIFHKCIAERLYNFKGYNLSLKDNRLEVCLAHTAPSNAITVITKAEIPRGQWIHLAMTYNGAAKASGIKLYLNGQEAELETTMDQLYKDIIFFTKDEPALQIGGWWRGPGFKGGRVDDVLVYDRTLTPFEIAILAGQCTWAGIVNKNYEQLTSKDKSILKEYYLSNEDEVIQSESEQLKKLRTMLSDSTEHVDEIMVMQEMPQPRQSHILIRGNYDTPGEEVMPNTPSSVLYFDNNLPKNRYGLALWLTDPRNPLTARVAVNRLWQLFFGTGIVKTAEDFGNQGEAPSHPELLDWLALQFINSGWDIKKLVKTIVLAATYRQDSKSYPALSDIDPDNRLLARGPANRLTAEMIRDNALFASNLLNLKIGGKSIKPYQPPGLWEINNTSYIADSTDEIYRRSLYVLIKRSVPNPTLSTLDAPDRSNCTLRRQKTNTPLQALVTLNDPTYLEASKVMGRQMAGHEDRSKAITEVYRKLTSRIPNDKELNLLLTMQEEVYEKFKLHPEKAKGWLNAGMYKINPSLDSIRIAANSIVASTIFNSDASLIKR
jgi:Protein of unknown function (DUF1553)/Protein of unknown function (DUF1549)/Concanavalin A-like lectin/glucanases superfamily/Planctomycete cytochrome C